MVPEEARPSTRLVNHDPGLGIQTDSYICGVYVLLAFEMFCGSEPLGNLSKTTLQCLRYRYLCMCLKE
ncbi:Glycoside hydrolase [Phytophthora megakarya]|uniref:Glycoside hydrolase n=1 Tax=Phytophthora megakarya TaxID=4795 RepID=A0A225W5H0_9STRA|nr:Glycoside hydrolase [Phytophthora megakarya]